MAKFLCGGSPQDYTMFANVEDGATSSQAYVTGEYVVRNKVLREVIAPIAQGDTITVGTNLSLTGTNVGKELSELNSSLSGIDIRLNTTRNQPEWSARGAGSWSPFSGAVEGILVSSWPNDRYPTNTFMLRLNTDGSLFSQSGSYFTTYQKWIDEVNNCDFCGTASSEYKIKIKKSGHYVVILKSTTAYAVGNFYDYPNLAENDEINVQTNLGYYDFFSLYKIRD